MTGAKTPSRAAKVLTETYGFEDRDVEQGPGRIRVYGDADKPNPLAYVFHALNRIGWRVFAVPEFEGDSPNVVAEPLEIDDIPWWKRNGEDRATKRLS